MSAERYFMKKQDSSNKVIPLFRQLPNGQRERVTSFLSQDEMLKCMGMTHPETGAPLYETSEVFRRSVEEILANTEGSTVGVQMETRSPIPTDAEMLQGLMEDAARQKYHQLVDRAGGNDAIAKLELVKAIMNPTEAQHNEFSLIQSQTDLASTRPMEQFLKARKEQGLGPQVDHIQVWDANDDEKEAQHNQEILDWMDTQGDSAL